MRIDEHPLLVSSKETSFFADILCLTSDLEKYS